MSGDLGQSPVVAGWKGIATYLNMAVRTVQRYEREHELPIRRPGGAKGAVIATRLDLDEWLAARPKRRLMSPTKRFSPSADSGWAALQIGTLRMHELRKEMSRRRAEMIAAIHALHGSIRAVDAASFSLLGNIQIGTAATQKSIPMDLVDGTRRIAG
jgi:hypothetical protein